MFKNCHVIGPVTDPAKYFTQPVPRGDRMFQMSSSALKEFGACPSRWVSGYESPESKSKKHGSLIDCMAMSPEFFHKRYIMPPSTYQSEGMQCPQCKSVTDSAKCKKCGCERVKVMVEKDWTPQSDTCQAWIEEQKANGLIVIYPDQHAEAKTAVDAIRRDSIISAFLDASDKQVHVAGEWYDESTGLVIPVKCMIDAVPRNDTPFFKNIADMKTTRNAAIMPWARQVFDMCYHVQGAFNFDLYRAARPKEDRCNFCHLVQENYPPFQTGRRILSETFMELGRFEYERNLKNYCWCLKNKSWPDYDGTDEAIQGWSVTEPTPWMEGATAFAPKYETPEPVEESVGDDVPA